mmetsp:Transcript_16896/g.25980  ORF Transcript_16896/g.25980 Transcript_16896/m.25980 type:complete len:168 (+) Transcript_16896:130-633(+)
MKLNLLLFFLLGVSVSASGIRGFTPIKGSERRLKSGSKSSSKSKGDDEDINITLVLTPGDAVDRCIGPDCKTFMNTCFGKRAHSGSTSKKSKSSSSSKRVRRLKPTSTTSTSTSSSSSDSSENTRTYWIGDLDDSVSVLCSSFKIATVTVDASSTSSSKKSSKSKDK